MQPFRPPAPDWMSAGQTGKLKLFNTKTRALLAGHVNSGNDDV
jgi:hypothetical protein